MTSQLKNIVHQIERLNDREQLEILNYLKQRFPEENSLQTNQTVDNDYKFLLQYLAETKNIESRRTLQEFRGIAPNLLKGQDAQAWVSEMRRESE
ncbi:MAG: hypothetical protein ACLFT0_14615 [Spirulinaceae cyanobacterium]